VKRCAADLCFGGSRKTSCLDDLRRWLVCLGLEVVEWKPTTVALPFNLFSAALFGLLERCFDSASWSGGYQKGSRRETGEWQVSPVQGLRRKKAG
jgi:hypothetical protein